MNVIGCLLLWCCAVLFLWIAEKTFKTKQVDYRQFPITAAKVTGVHDFRGKRWLVEFTDRHGRRAIGADNVLAESTFHPENYPLPKRGTTEYVYYWENHNRSTYRFNGIPLLYTIHFCNEAFYTLHKEKAHRWRIGFWIAGILMFFLGIVVLFFGNH